MDTLLEEKYRRDTLTPGELRLLREKLAGSSDEDISSEMERHWMTGDFDGSAISEERVDNLYLDIRKKLAPEKQSRTWIWWSGIAASLLLPLSQFFTARSITTIRQQSSQEIVISTAKGEQSIISLPDGTTVKLNELSNLKYSPGSFSRKKREIEFEGEGFFNVTKNDECPFIIEADKMTTTVLGTSFNLEARVSDAFNKVLLIEGSIKLVSSISGETIVMNPNEEVTLNKNTGKMVVTRPDSKESITSWVKKEIVLKRVSLREITDLLSDKYDIVFDIDKGVDMEELFTGTLPTNDLLLCAEILEYAYGVKIKLSGGAAIISK